MRSRLVAIFCAVICGTIISSRSALSDAPVDWTVVHDLHRSAVVKIVTEYITPDRATTEVEYGTGFFFNNIGHLITAAHVVNKRTGFDATIKVFPSIGSSEYYVGHVLERHLDADLAVVAVQSENPQTFLMLGESLNFRTLSPVFYMGYPRGEWSSRAGTFSSAVSSGKWRLEFGTGRGASGAPVLNRCGAVVAVVVNSHDGFEQHTEAVPVYRVLGQLSGYIETVPIARSCAEQKPKNSVKPQHPPISDLRELLRAACSHLRAGQFVGKGARVAKYTLPEKYVKAGLIVYADRKAVQAYAFEPTERQAIKEKYMTILNRAFKRRANAVEIARELEGESDIEPQHDSARDIR